MARFNLLYGNTLCGLLTYYFTSWLLCNDGFKVLRIDVAIIVKKSRSQVYLTDRNNFNTVLKHISNLIITFVYLEKFRDDFEFKVPHFCQHRNASFPQKRNYEISRQIYARFLAIQIACQWIAFGIVYAISLSFHKDFKLAERKEICSHRCIYSKHIEYMPLSRIMWSWNLLSLYFVLILILDEIKIFHIFNFLTCAYRTGFFKKLQSFVRLQYTFHLCTLYAPCLTAN